MSDSPTGLPPYVPARAQLAALSVRPTVARVDTAALAHNLDQISALVSPRVRVLAVVKADAYGHGAVPVGRALLDAGAWGLAVSLVEEGVELRTAGIVAPIVVLGGGYPGSEALMVATGLRPVVWERAHLERLAAAADSAGTRALVHLKVDTGMSRLGVLPRDLPALIDAYEAEFRAQIEIEAVMTHLACADEDEDRASAGQLAKFEACLELLRTRGIEPRIRHVANSAAMVRLPESRYDMVRPGIALYGAASTQAALLPGLRPTICFESKILGLRELPAGSSVSYGHRDTLTRDSRLGILPVGYEDGYPRTAHKRAEVLVRGRRCPIVGRITMDTSMVDLSDLPEVAVGDPVILMGSQGEAEIDCFELAERARVSPYEILCGFSKRVPRV